MDRWALIASNCLLMLLRYEPSCQLTKEAHADVTRYQAECKSLIVIVAILATLVFGNVILKITLCSFCMISTSGVVTPGPVSLLTTGGGGLLRAESRDWTGYPEYG